VPLRPDEVSQLSRLFDQAQELGGELREPWLMELDRANPKIARRLRVMLQQSDAPVTESLPRLRPAHDDESVAAAGEQVGPYVLVREIGRGGMGSVWLADRADGAFKRHVALKLPRMTWSTGLGKRIAREREIGALLEHPNIARLYDAGVDAHGRPYIAMEYIEGVPIDGYCEKRALALRATLTLFVQVVKAVAYAHGRLVLHRDLKPSNVIIDAAGTAHLLDFGIAKLLDKSTASELTQEHGRALTPSYAAPEHIAGRPLGVTADVYALGVMLYELLTGTLPFTAKRQTPGALEDAILAGDAPLPSSRVKDPRHARQLRGDLDALIGKAMKRDPNERYQTAEALAADIQRYLDGQAIAARPDSTWYRLRKALVRHRVAVTATAAVIAAVFAGGTIALIQSRRAADEAERARAATAFVSELFRVGTAQLAPSAAGTPRPTQSILIERGAELIEARFEKQPQLKAELYGVVGRVYGDLGQDRLASEFATRQLRLLREQKASAGQVARSLMLLSQTALAARRDADAEDFARQAVDAVAAGDEIRPEAMACLARAELRNGKVEQAEQTIAQARATILRQNFTKSAALPWLLYVEAGLLVRRNRFEEALPLIQQAIAEALQIEGPESRAATEMQLALAIQLINRNRNDEGRRFSEAALATFQRLGGVHLIRAALAKAELQIRLLDLQTVGYAEAIGVLEEVAQFLRVQSSALPAEVLAEVEFHTAEAHVFAGEYARAEPLAESSVHILRGSSQSMYNEFMYVSVLGELKKGLGDHESADRYLRERMDNRIKSGEGNMPFAAIDWQYIASNLRMQGRYQEAAEFLAGAPAFSDDPGDKRAGYARLIAEELARIRLEAGDVEGAKEMLPPALPGLSDTYGMWFASYQLYGEVWCAAGDPKRGLTHMLTAEEAMRRVSGPNNPALARLRTVAAICALEAGDRVRAEILAIQARRAYEEQPRVSPYFKEPLKRLEQKLRTKSI
jgi:serine/threonine protein kinase